MGKLKIAEDSPQNWIKGGVKQHMRHKLDTWVI